MFMNNNRKVAVAGWFVAMILAIWSAWLSMRIYALEELLERLPQIVMDQTLESVYGPQEIKAIMPGK